MDTLDQYRDVVYKILSQYTPLMSQSGITSTVIISEDRNHFIVINEGWEGKRRIHNLVFHAEFRDRKLWIHHDGIDHGITEELVAAGIPKDQIVLAFHPPHIRQHTGYAVA
ncbi:XisI protein [Leptolyngbya sp. 7M]|uniref:XisI protein n=1 Tax=Leptolyngbya sp. 7M TaxID=2812896 RepID=UPI001B8AD1BB|nr:XisI protein [Leptolyngbya sp. 7M]QYO65157.1 XisI protein [Leptolyngbya sp. 7M]